MKKSVIIVAVLVLAGAIGLVVYLNRGPSATSTSAQSAADTAPDTSSSSDAMRPIRSPKGQPSRLPVTEDEKQAQRKALEEFISRAHVDKDFQEAADVLKEMMTEFPKEGQAVMQKFIDKLSGPEIINEYKAELASQFSTAELDELAKIHSDRDVVLFHEASKKANTKEGMKELQEHMAKFEIEKLPADRRDALSLLADNQLQALSGLNDLGLSDAQKGEADEFIQAMRNATIAQLDLTLKTKSVDELRHLQTQTGNPLYMRELKIRAQTVMRNVMALQQM